MAAPGPEGPFWPGQESLEHDMEDGDWQREVGLTQATGPAFRFLMPRGARDCGENPQALE